MSRYAKLNGQNIEYAPRVITRGGIYYNPYPVVLMIADGYKEVVDTSYPSDGKNYRSTWEETETQIVRKWIEVVPTDREVLEAEKAELMNWLEAHDYIGTKIATGRATIADYAEEIEQMKVKSARVAEINELLERLNEESV